MHTDRRARKPAKTDMCLCNPAIKLPAAAPNAAHCTCSIRQILYMNRELTFLERTDYESDTPDSPKGPFPDRYKFINTTFYCQAAKNTLTVFRVNVTARQAFTTWRAVYRSGPAPIPAPARWEHIPNPEITLRVSCAFLQNAGNVFMPFFKSTQVRQ